MSEMKFEKAMFRLEKIVEELERGDLDIDKSLEIFEKGSKCHGYAQKNLTKQKQK